MDGLIGIPPSIPIIQKALSAGNIPSHLESIGTLQSRWQTPRWNHNCPLGKRSHSYLTPLPHTAIEEAGSVAEIAEIQKRKNNEALSAVQVFTPIAVETSGVFGPETRCILHKLASRVRSVTNKEKSHFYHLSFIKNNFLIFISHDTLLKPILIIQ